MSFTSVPFKIDDNFTQIAGIAKFSAAGVVLEYEGKIFGIIKGGVKESRFALEDLLDVKFKKGVFKRGARIEIRTKTFAKLNEMVNRDGKITLKLERGDFERAQEAVEKLQKHLNDCRENELPARTPISRLFDEGVDEIEDSHDR